MKILEITEKTKTKIAEAIMNQFGADIVELHECFPTTLGFTAHSDSRTFHGWFTYDGRLSKRLPITEEK